ncbi:MAG: hypothetical protein D6690_07685 [Nitrospirae bacterium]|nr:MAG: hypothetical protein D6690_07685 [Nitrospirota bacterium]
MPQIICAWCFQEGIRRVIKLEEKTLDGRPDSHGICDDHRRALFANFAMTSSSSRQISLHPSDVHDRIAS